MAFVVFEGGRYLVGQVGDPDSQGVEHGCYTLNGANLTPTVVNATCPGAVDTNGDAGLANGGVGDPIPYVLTPPHMLTLGTPPIEGVTLFRAIPN